jgi:hypothetical protein
VVEKLSVIHLLLVLGGAACVYLVIRELRRAYVSQWRLFAPGIAALAVAAGLFLIQVAAGQPRLYFLAAAVIGLLVGGVRAMMIDLKHDLYRPQIMISQSAKQVLLLVGVGVAVCVVLEIVGTVGKFPTLRLWAAISAVVCAMAMLMRACVLTLRLRLRHT